MLDAWMGLLYTLVMTLVILFTLKGVQRLLARISGKDSNRYFATERINRKWRLVALPQHEWELAPLTGTETTPTTSDRNGSILPAEGTSAINGETSQLTSNGGAV